MKDLIGTFILTHCFKIMVTGFALSAAGIVLYAEMIQKNPLMRRIGFIIAVTGIGIYLIGRIGVIIQRRKIRKQRMDARTSAGIE